MFFVTSKLFWHLAAPSHLMAILLMGAAICLVFRRRRSATVLGVLGLAILLAGGVAPLPVLAAHVLEDQYPRPPWPAHVDGILILGSGFDTDLLMVRHAPQSNGGAFRLVEGFAAARHYPHALVVFSGGSAVPQGDHLPEAGTARYVLEEMGLEPRRLILEPRARNTYENIVFSKQLVKPKPGQVWLLATSAMHMRRAMAIAKKQRWRMLAWPTDFATAPNARGTWLNVAENLGMADYVVHEWIGFIAYRMTGKAV